MLQRIQTIYLLIASVLMLALPFFAGIKIVSLLIFSILSGIVPLINIFLFKQRKKQILLAKITTVVILLFALLFWYLGFTQGSSEFKVIILLIPFVALVFNTLALRAIKKDEKLVRSMDRLR